MAELLASGPSERTAGIAERMKNVVSGWGEVIFKAAVSEGMHIPEELVEQMEAKADGYPYDSERYPKVPRLADRIIDKYNAAENDEKVARLAHFVSGK